MKYKLISIFSVLTSIMLFQNCSEQSFSKNDPTIVNSSMENQGSLNNEGSLISVDSNNVVSEKPSCSGLNNLAAEWTPYMGLPSGTDLKKLFDNILKSGMNLEYPPSFNEQYNSITSPAITISGTLIAPSTMPKNYYVFLWGYDDQCKFRVYRNLVPYGTGGIDPEDGITLDTVRFPTLVKALSGLPVQSNTDFTSAYYDIYYFNKLNFGSFYTLLNQKFYQLAVGRSLDGGSALHLNNLVTF